MLLTDLIGTMRGTNGHVYVDGLCTSATAVSYGTGRIELAISRPAMNLRGIRSGDVGAS